ncbi:LIM domain containing protein [Histomonas meleagridis]|uniref:LIM domain containing protein n=1 Tax=Histomonas meleagridis TaxID=135588 RepID=UPI00355995E9|nr:LIM domain containing protein [Histomonas meleagridis]KAH0799339.1 LIM domain containing protein [Histomonas meleagridis]
MSDGKLFPLAHIVAVEPYDPPNRLWHVPNVHAGYCPGCETKIEKDVLTYAGHDWHPECFKCSLCNQPFQTDSCVQKDDLILHPKCFKQCFSERCAKCTRLINPKKVVQAMGKNFHAKCFTCMRCGDQNIQQTKFNALYHFPYCNHCFEELSEYFPKCLVCKKVITPSQERKEFFFQGKKHFVHFPDCFRCIYCPTNLTPAQCCVYNDRLVCKHCYETGMSRICASCNEPIFDQGNKMEDIWWHTIHFQCSVCSQPLKPNTCVFNAGILKCKSCSSEDRVRCPECGRPIMEKGKRACGFLWHPECLKCKYCMEPLGFKGAKFTNIGGKPCCRKCLKRLQEEGKIDEKGNLKIRHRHHHKSSDSSS